LWIRALGGVRVTGYCRLVGKPARAADALEQGREELHTALAEMENALAGALPDDTGTVRLDAGDHLVIPKLTAEDIPAEARELKEELSGLLPFAPIASLLIELDGRTGFLDCFTHAGGKKLARSRRSRNRLPSRRSRTGLCRDSLRSSAPISGCSGAPVPSACGGWPGVRRGWC